MFRSLRQVCRRYSQVSQTNTFRTSENNPVNHNEKQIGLYYTVSPDTCKVLFSHGALPRSFQKQTKTFTETAIMVRQPALDIINCLTATDFEKPVVRYVLYGEKGTGKSLTIAHLVHYAHQEGYLVIHIPWISEWLRRVPRHKEMTNSTTREGMVDIPLDAAAWLLHFKNQNQSLLRTGNLKTSTEHVWSKREKTPAGAPLLDLVEIGISRVKYACDVIDALITEIKHLSGTHQVKTFCALNGFNSFVYGPTRLSTPTKRIVQPEEVSLTASFMRLAQNDWIGGAVVVSVDQLAVPEDHHESHLPKYLLYKKGFEHLDPFVPVGVERYSDKEFLSCVAYYRDRLWLRGPPALDQELRQTSARNPYRFMEICAPL